jgi:hypothetical protein
METTRRDFFFLLSSLAFAPPASLLASQGGIAGKPLASFSPQEKEDLGNLCEQIFPTDEYPGAKELGAVLFLETILKQAHPEWWNVYHAGLASTGKAARKLHQRGFSELSFAEQTELLKQMEKGGLPKEDWTEVKPSEFFNLVRDHTLQAMYSHPKYGGNKNKTAWKMIGYDDWWVGS